MTSTTKLNLPLIDAGQAQKNVTHNEAIFALDQLVQASVISQTLGAPPATSNDGDSYIVGPGATGAWVNKTGQIAAWQQGVWNFYSPDIGWLVWVQAQSRIFVWSGTAWIDAFGVLVQTLQGVELFGLGTTATTANPFSAKLNALLVTAQAVSESGTGDLRMVLNKSATGNTVSQLYQDNYSGRAEIGLCGDDNLHIKVSPDGSTWLQAAMIAPSGLTTLQQLALTSALPVASGGTGATTPAAGRSGLGAAASGVNSDITSLTALTQATGFKNRLRNASFAINQRAVSGTVTLAAGTYGHDGVKGGASGCTYTFSTSGLDTTITISAGSLVLPIDAAFVEGGSYVVQNAGTAQARVWQGTGSTGSGSYAAAPFTVTGLTAATQTNVEFASGTLLRPQLEPGAVATAFERLPPAVQWANAQYYYQSYVNASAAVVQFSSYANSGSYSITQITFPRMRAAPTLLSLGTWTYGNVASFGFGTPTPNSVYLAAQASATGYLIVYSPANGGFTLSAEI